MIGAVRSCQTEKEVPQPQVAFALGLWKTKPPLKSSVSKSRTRPDVYRKDFLSTMTRTPRHSKTRSNLVISSSMLFGLLLTD